MRNTKLKKPYAILVYGHVDILWTYKGATLMILVSSCRFNSSFTDFPLIKLPPETDFFFK